jgi:hypothetical protein
MTPCASGLRVLQPEQKTGSPGCLEQGLGSGLKDAVWARRDPGLALLHGDPEFDRLYPEKPAPQPASGSH